MDDFEEYKAAGEEVWSRQSGLRATRREADTLAEEQKVQYDALLRATKTERILCEAAFQAGFIDSLVEGTINQGEIAEEIREQAENIGIPWRGLAVEELMELLKENADAKRKRLSRLVEKTLEMSKTAERIKASAESSCKRVDMERVKATDRINSLADRLVDAIRRRQEQLLQSTQNFCDTKKAAFVDMAEQCNTQDERARRLLRQGNEIKEKDDLHLLADMFKREVHLDEQAAGIETVLSNYLSAEAMDHDSTLSSEVKFRFDPFLESRISCFGTVGDLEQLDFARINVGHLCWDDQRSDVEVLDLQDNKTTLRHVGKRECRATAFLQHGFSSGVAVIRFRLSGLKDNQWVALGVATAASINSPRFISDTLVYEALSIGPFSTNSCVQNASLISIVIDTALRTVQYYKNGVRVKVAVLQSLRESKVLQAKGENAAEQVTDEQDKEREEGKEDKTSENDPEWFFPFCTLFHPGQTVKLVHESIH